MIVVREKYFEKFDKKYGIYKYKQTSYWLFGIIPLYIANKML